MHRVSWLLDNWSQSEGFLVASGEFYARCPVGEQVRVSRCGWAVTFIVQPVNEDLPTS